MASDGARTFRTSPAAYDAHIGRYGTELARGLIRFAGVTAGHRVLDVGCGTGMLTQELAALSDAPQVSAVDPSEPFVAACRGRVPTADVRLAGAEQLPFDDDTFDRALAQLVLSFLTDPVRGVTEMCRVTCPGGRVAAAVWDYAGEMTLLRAFWDTAVALDPSARELDEGVSMPGCDPESLARLWRAAGLSAVDTCALRPSVEYASFDELWSGFTAGVAPSGAYTVSLDESGREALRHGLFSRLGFPTGAFRLTARAWAVTGTV